MIVVVSHVLDWRMILLLSRWHWRWHIQKDLVRFVYEVIKEFTSEMLDTWTFEIILDL